MASKSFRELGSFATDGEATMVENIDAVGELEGFAGVLLDEQHADTVGRPRTAPRVAGDGPPSDARPSDSSSARSRRRRGGQRTSQREDLLFTSGAQSGTSAQERLELREHLERGLTVTAAQAQVGSDVEAHEDRPVLGHEIRDPGGPSGADGVLAHLSDDHLHRQGRELTRQREHRGRLPRPVRPEECHDLAR